MNYQWPIKIALISSLLLSCSGKKEKDFKYEFAYPNGFKVTHYSAAQENNWIATGGTSVFKFSNLEDDGTINITYSSYSDTFGNCDGEISGTTEDTDISTLLESSDPVSGSDVYDINEPYQKPEDPYSSLKSSDSVIVKVINYNVDNMNLSSCPFPNYTQNSFVIQLYRNGDMIITDWNRSIDYFLIPN